MGKRQTGGQTAFGVCRTGQARLITVGAQLITKSGLVRATSAMPAAEGRWPWGDSPWFGGSQNSRLIWVGRDLRSHSTPQSPLCSCPVASLQPISHPATCGKARSALNYDVLSLSEHPKSHTWPQLWEKLRADQSSGGAKSRRGRGAGSSSCRAAQLRAIKG